MGGDQEGAFGVNFFESMKQITFNSSLVSCFLTMRLHLSHCDFDSRPLFLVPLFLSPYIHTHTYIFLVLLCTVFHGTHQTGSGQSHRFYRLLAPVEQKDSKRIKMFFWNIVTLTDTCARTGQVCVFFFGLNPHFCSRTTNMKICFLTVPATQRLRQEVTAVAR